MTAFWKNENTNLSNIVWSGDKFSATAFPIELKGITLKTDFVKGGGRRRGGSRFQMRHVNGKIFSEILVGGTKGGGFSVLW